MSGDKRQQQGDPSDEAIMDALRNVALSRALLYSDALVVARAVLALKPAVPDGWKLVPVRPTVAMFSTCDNMHKDKYVARGRAIDAWERMIAAAPQHGGTR